MPVINRKCNKCKQSMEIDIDNIVDVIRYEKKFYHKACFIEEAERLSQAKRAGRLKWQNALENIEDLEDETKFSLRQDEENKTPFEKAKDQLNAYLLSVYNVTSVSEQRFWIAVTDLDIGIYKNKKCKRVDVDTLLSTWKWHQQKLNEIDKLNKANNRGPKDDRSRILYDFAIVVGQVPNYLTYKEKQRIAELERQQTSKETLKIDYSKIKTPVKNTNGLDDISSILDEF